MQKFGIFFFLWFITLQGSAQKANDITDTRKKNESFLKVPKGDLRSELSTFTLTGIDESIGKQTLQKIPFSSLTDNSIKFQDKNITAIIFIAPFDSSKHKLYFDEKTLTKIDKKTYYGNYGIIPKTCIDKINIIIDKDTVLIPSSAYNDLYNIRFAYADKDAKRSLNAIYHSKNPNRIYLYFFNKDNTGSYEVTWIIQDKKYLRRVLDYGFM